MEACQSNLEEAMSIFGWNYPPGAENDPSAPYNQVDPPEGEIASIDDLFAEVQGRTPRAEESVERSIRRRLYKSTTCGIGFVAYPDRVVVSGYCEGWDGECKPHSLSYPFTADDFWEAVSQADNDGCKAWDDSHGCEKCHEPGDCFDETGLFPLEFGDWPINKECEHCNGEGVIL